MAAHAQTSQPQAPGQLQHPLIFKQTGLELSNQTKPNLAPPTGGITAVLHIQLYALRTLHKLHLCQKKRLSPGFQY